jgi:hypothetical protein
VLTLDLEIEQLALARQRGFQREAAVSLMLRRAAAQERGREDAPPAARRDRIGPAARLLAYLAPRT